MCEKFCETCAHWGRITQVCSRLRIHCGMLCRVESGGDVATPSTFGCTTEYEAQPAGPFVATDSRFERCTHVAFGNSGEGFTLHVKRDEAERLVEWLNEWWAERGSGQ